MDHQAYQQFLKSFPCGSKFRPEDHVLILDYLLPKTNNDVSIDHLNIIHEANIYEHNPKVLTDGRPAQDVGTWYFFTSRNRKYPNGSRPDRTTTDGTWKASTKNTEIKHEGKVVGFKRSLSYVYNLDILHSGNPPNEKWLMQEFTLKIHPTQAQKRNNPANEIEDKENNSGMLDECVLCKIYRKDNKNSKYDDREEMSEVEVEDDTTTEAGNDMFDVSELFGDMDVVLVPTAAPAPVADYRNQEYEAFRYQVENNLIQLERPESMATPHMISGRPEDLSHKFDQNPANVSLLGSLNNHMEEGCPFGVGNGLGLSQRSTEIPLSRGATNQMMEVNYGTTRMVEDIHDANDVIQRRMPIRCNHVSELFTSLEPTSN